MNKNNQTIAIEFKKLNDINFPPSELHVLKKLQSYTIADKTLGILKDGDVMFGVFVADFNDTTLTLRYFNVFKLFKEHHYISIAIDALFKEFNNTHFIKGTFHYSDIPFYESLTSLGITPKNNPKNTDDNLGPNYLYSFVAIHDLFYKGKIVGENKTIKTVLKNKHPYLAYYLANHSLFNKQFELQEERYYEIEENKNQQEKTVLVEFEVNGQLITLPHYESTGRFIVDPIKEYGGKFLDTIPQWIQLIEKQK